MSYNGSGTFQINTSGQPVVAGTVISSTAFNALTADLATGLSTAITKDGQTTTTVRIPFAAGINSSLTTDSSSTTTGSIITAGGVGIVKNLYVGANTNIAGTLGVTGVATFSAAPIYSSLTASSAVATDASKALVSVTNTGTGNNVLATSPAITTPTISSLSSAAATALTLQSAGTTAITVDTSQNVGIGTTAPGYRLEVKGPAATAGQLSIHDGTGDTVTSGNNAGSLLFQCRDSSVRTIAEIDGVHTTTNGTGGAMVFQTRISDVLAERMRIDSSGNVGIGTTAPASRLNIATGASTSCTFTLTANNTGSGAGDRGRLDFYSADNSGTAYQLGYMDYDRSDGTGTASYIAFANRVSGTVAERMRIGSSGNLLVGTTSTFDVTSGAVTQLSGQCAVYNSGTTNTLMSFYNASQSARVGFIGSSGNTTSYNSGSDYRLKENITNVSNAISKIEALRPVTFNWKVSPQVGKVTGFIAHELAEIYPEAVTGEKDAMCDDGVTPNYQMVDQSKLVPLLTAAIQEQQALITALTARITALENK